MDLPAGLGPRLLDRTAGRRAHPTSAPTPQATIDQVRRLVGLLPASGDIPMFVFDAGYDPIAISEGLRDERAQVLVRLRSDRVFYTDPPARPAGTKGRPRRHGKRFSSRTRRPRRSRTPSIHLVDPRYGSVHVRAWRQLHPQLSRRGRWAGKGVPPIVRGTVIRVDVERLPKPSSRANKTLWLWSSGPGEPDLELCFRAYLRRFDLEHTYRFAKNTLGWTTPALCTPEQADRWTWLIVAAYTQLRLARGLVDDLRLPWERPRDPTCSPRPASAEDFVDFAPPSAPRPVHRNPTHPGPDARKGPADPHEPATR